jgi:gamma-glutamyltranspeptidase / glutathione hydrolase
LLPGIESEPKGMNTTHFSVLDAAGNRAAVTITVNLFFGNGYMPAGTGVLLNNEMDDFSVKPGTPNVFGPFSDSSATRPTRSHPTNEVCRACPPRSSRRRRA